jgi:hypothetical protein
MKVKKKDFGAVNGKGGDDHHAATLGGADNGVLEPLERLDILMLPITIGGLHHDNVSVRQRRGRT